MSGFVPKADIRTVRRQHREPHVPLIAATGATSALNLRPRRAEGCNCSNYQQPEWNYPDARYCLQDQPRQKQPLPAQHAEQQRGSHDIDRPYDRRRQARESTNDIGYTRDDEGNRKSRYG
jgi:hypothetical protein